MVLTTSFPYSPPSSTADAARTRGADASAVVLRPGKPRAERVRAARTCSVRLGPVSGAGAGLPGLGTCFESRREALWGWGRGGVTCRRQRRRPGKVPFPPWPAVGRSGGGPSSAPPAAPVRAAQPGVCGAGPAPLAGGLCASSARAPARPPAAPAIQLVRSMASTSWRLKVSGGRPRCGRRGNAQGAGLPGAREAVARVGHSPAGGAGRRGAGVPTASRETCGRSGAAGLLAR